MLYPYSTCVLHTKIQFIRTIGKENEGAFEKISDGAEKMSSIMPHCFRCIPQYDSFRFDCE